MSNPASTATTGESFNGGGGNTNIGQTFTVGATCTLQAISIYASGGTGTGPGTNITLNLYDLGVQSPPGPNPYTAAVSGGNLFGSGAGLSISYSSQVEGILEFDFTGSDQVTLMGGHMYAFELAGAAGTTPVFWLRAGSDTYAGGTANRNQSQIGFFGASRDFAMAVYTNLPPPPPPPGTPRPGGCTILWNTVRQRIDGFGASSAFRSGPWTTAIADMFFSTNNGIGLSLLRSRIAPDGTSSEQTIMQMARDRGARVWSSPWTPPAAYKDSGVLNGGNFVATTANLQNYANQLAGHVANMKNIYGIDLYTISVQNEPNNNTSNYESCIWSPQAIHDFVPYLRTALDNNGAGSTRIMLPEDVHWESFYYTAAMVDTNVAAKVGIIGCHNYDGSPPSGLPLPLMNYGKPTWETEVSLLSGSDSSMANGMYWALRIHAFMTVAEANAWHYWWLIPNGGAGNQGLTDVNGNPTRRMYVLGNYSRFVRPDFYRIGVITNLSFAEVSAYKDPASSRFAIVAVNPAPYPINETFSLSNFTATAVTPWVTSATLSLAAQPPVAVTNSVFQFQLPQLSVVTFVGQATSNTAPVLAPVPDQTINAGVTLLITNVAFDPDVPSQALTFSLLTNPPNATINASNGIFTWRPTVSQANTTNLVKTVVRDSGSPGLGDTNTFAITVNSLNQPVFSSVFVENGQVNFLVDGDPGPDYMLLASTNLIQWQPLLTTNPLVLPVPFVITNSGEPQQYYRIQLGP